MQLEEIDAMVSQLVDMLQAEPAPNAGSLGRALLILQAFDSDPSATEADHANLRVVENEFMSWFDDGWQRFLGTDSGKARAKLLEDLDRLEMPFRSRLP